MFKMILLGLFLSVWSLPSYANCVQEFKQQLNQARTYDEKKDAVKGLSKKELKCIYLQTSSRSNVYHDDLVDDTSRANGVVVKYFGRSSVPVFRSFEKHFFAFEYHTGVEVFGYNKVFAGGLLGSPGFFQVQNKNGRGIDLYPSNELNYANDFESLISGTDFQNLQGAEKNSIKNNKNNVIFDGLKDQLKKINSEVFTGRAMKKRNNRWQTQNYFILLRK